MVPIYYLAQITLRTGLKADRVKKRFIQSDTPWQSRQGVSVTSSRELASQEERVFEMV